MVSSETKVRVAAAKWAIGRVIGEEISRVQVILGPSYPW